MQKSVLNLILNFKTVLVLSVVGLQPVHVKNILRSKTISLTIRITILI